MDFNTNSLSFVKETPLIYSPKVSEPVKINPNVKNNESEKVSNVPTDSSTLNSNQGKAITNFSFAEETNQNGIAEKITNKLDSLNKKIDYLKSQVDFRNKNIEDLSKENPTYNGEPIDKGTAQRILNNEKLNLENAKSNLEKVGKDINSLKITEKNITGLSKRISTMEETISNLTNKNNPTYDNKSIKDFDKSSIEKIYNMEKANLDRAKELLENELKKLDK